MYNNIINVLETNVQTFKSKTTHALGASHLPPDKCNEISL